LNIFPHNTYGKNQLTAKQILTDPVLFLAFGFGAGLANKAPGTWGTAATIPLYCALAQAPFWFYSLFVVVATLVGIYLCGKAATQLGEHDFKGIVWDEVAGYLITMWWVPFSGLSLVVGFILFRLFDIFKPWPIKWADQQVQGGLGIMLDDVLAGIMAAGVMLVFF
jgi:phosphatidylglycerophosphatase A